MSPRVPIHGIDVLDGYIVRTRDFMNDWLRFNQLIGVYNQPGINKLQLETHFLQLKSKLARDHRVLSDRLGSDCKFTLDVINIVSSATSLENIFAQSDVAVKKLQREWHHSFITVNETLGNLEDKHKRAEAGFWAPGAGDGMAVTANMTDEQKLQVMISTMKAATEAGDIDKMMTAIADNFSFEQGGKTEVRALFQAYKLQGGFDGAVLDIANAKIEIDGNKGKFAPVEFIGPSDQVTLTVVGERNGDRWLITSMAGL